MSGQRTYTDIEFGTSMGFRPVRLDLRLPAAATGTASVRWSSSPRRRLLGGTRRNGPVLRPILDSLLGRGVAVAAVDRGLSTEALFPACLHDVAAAVRWLLRFGRDPERRDRDLG